MLISSQICRLPSRAPTAISKTESDRSNDQGRPQRRRAEAARQCQQRERQAAMKRRAFEDPIVEPQSSGSARRRSAARAAGNGPSARPADNPARSNRRPAAGNTDSTSHRRSRKPTSSQGIQRRRAAQRKEHRQNHQHEHQERPGVEEHGWLNPASFGLFSNSRALQGLLGGHSETRNNRYKSRHRYRPFFVPAGKLPCTCPRLTSMSRHRA